MLFFNVSGIGTCMFIINMNNKEFILWTVYRVAINVAADTYRIYIDHLVDASSFYVFSFKAWGHKLLASVFVPPTFASSMRL